MSWEDDYLIGFAGSPRQATMQFNSAGALNSRARSNAGTVESLLEEEVRPGPVAGCSLAALQLQACLHSGILSADKTMFVSVISRLPEPILCLAAPRGVSGGCSTRELAQNSNAASRCRLICWTCALQPQSASASVAAGRALVSHSQ
jgi:hypothetical protein